jgi:hypothetical protein
LGWNQALKEAGFGDALNALASALEALRAPLAEQTERSEGLGSCAKRAGEVSALLARIRGEEAKNEVRWVEVFGQSLQLHVTPLVPAEVRKRWESSYGDKQGQLTLYEATGCDKCANRGYRGRLGIHELLVNSRAIKALIQTHARVEDIHKTALAEGMLTLKQDGIEKVLQGVTDMLQVRAVCIK